MNDKINLDNIPPDLSPLEHTDRSEGKKAAAAGSGEDPKGSEAGPTASEGRVSTIWTQTSARLRPPRTEPPSKKPSMTVPGMDTPIDVLLNRYLSGQSITLNSTGTYNEQLPPEFDHYDKVEKAHFAQNVNKSLDIYETDLKRKLTEEKTKEVETLKSRIAELEKLQKTNEEPS